LAIPARVADQLILEVALPVDLDGPRDVAHVVEEDVLVALDDPDLGIVPVLLDPVGRDEDFGVDVGVCHRAGSGCVRDSAIGGRPGPVKG